MTSKISKKDFKKRFLKGSITAAGSIIVTIGAASAAKALAKEDE